VTDRIPVATLVAAAPMSPGLVPYPAPVEAPPAHRWGLGAYLLAELVFLLVSALVGALVIGDGPVPPWALAVAVGVPTLTAAGVAVLITRVRGNGPIVDLHLRGGWNDVGMGLAFGFGGLFLSLPASYAYVALVGEDASSAVGDIFGGITASPPVAFAIVLIVVLVAPLCEEILYRGLLWGGLTRLGANRWLAFGVTTVIFALAHFEWPRALLLLVVAVPIGLARAYTGGLIAPIVAHQVNNLLPGIGLYLMLTGAFPVL
jgi:membrane protease YdiL (CAAX protease family)